jgi:hypothetical protein
MRLVAINWNPTNHQLRQFGFVCLFALPLVGWMWGAHTQLLIWLTAAGIVLVVLALGLPKLIKPIFVALSIVTVPIGLVIGELILLLIYFGVFLPIGLFFRLIGRDALQLKFDHNVKSYWQTKRQPTSSASYYRQS